MGLSDNTFVFLISKLWKYSRGNRKKVLTYLTLQIISNLGWLVEPLIIAAFINVIQESGVTEATLPTLALYLVAYAGMSLVFWMFHGPARILEMENAFYVRAQYKKYLLDGTMDLPPSWHTDHHSGDTIDKVEKGCYALFDFTSGAFDLVRAVIFLIGSFIALTYFNIHASYIVLTIIVLTLTIIYKFDKILAVMYRKLSTYENEISAKVYDVISNITTVIILRIENLVSKAIFKKIMKPYALYKRRIRISELKWFIVSMLAASMYFLVLGSYIYAAYIAGSAVLIGTIFALYDYVSKINDLFFSFAWKYGQMVRWKARIQNAEELADEFKEKHMPDSISVDNWKMLSVRNLNFSYSGKKMEAQLKNVNFDILRGEKIAFVGESGSGKTTLLKIIRDLYTAQSGVIKLDGKKLKHSFGSIGAHVALVPQDPEIFNSTIKENVTVGVSHRVDYIKKYTDMANFTGVVKRLPKKWDSSIVEKGVNLSGGQKQRLALARGLLAAQDKEFLLLDEPTSSVDPKNEFDIYQKIFNKFKGKTIISSIHRLHLLPMFDKIILFEEGNIVAQGSFEELHQNSRMFRSMWKKYTSTMKQSRKFN